MIMRPLLEDRRIADRSHMAKVYVPKILAKEKEQTQAEISGQYLAAIFDGTTRLGEALNCI
eukprot:COSAG01_NODE_23316_length_819_cov_16.711111_1_plen_60_part_10